MPFSASSSSVNSLLRIFLNLCRLVLSLTLILSGFVKAIDPLGTTYKIEDYLKAFGGFFTDLLPLAEPAAWCLITIEFVLGICLLLNIRTNWTAWLTLAFYCVMTPLTLFIALKNPVSDCGCFGDAIVLTNWQTFYKNVILIALAIMLVCFRRNVHQTWQTWVEVVFVACALVFVLCFMTWTLLHLPIKDFRPYKIGNNIPELMEIPEGAPADEYEIALIYAKDGVEQTFTLQNYPKGDSTWTFVDQQSKLIKKGYEPPIHDFELLTMDFEDITYDILESEEPVTLVIMYDLAKTDRKQFPKLKALYEKSSPIFFVTGSGSNDIYAFGVELGLTQAQIENTFCTCDPVTLKTIVRANPGVIEVQYGTIIDKYNLRNR
jgi:uncharacterized membrane protein YphA (DoxX/SURF4 family)